MTNYSTNGHLLNIIKTAGEDVAASSHYDAKAYLASFRNIESTFFEKVHPFVDIGLAIKEVLVSRGRTPNIFTAHGCRHVSDLVNSLDELVKAVEDSHSPLSVLEAYILLCAAHVHDAANVEGREGHPEKCSATLEKYKELFRNTAVIQQIYDVASVHGGRHPEFGKDTFRGIWSDNASNPRLPLLAALLRLGDELSENLERVPEHVIAAHAHSEVSKLAFAYARCFARFELRKESLYLVFNVHPNEHALVVADGKKRIGFYDFLESKIDVIDQEARYCSQYARPALNIVQISVAINVYSKDAPSPIEMSEKFTLYLNHGYPALDNKSMCSRSPELRDKSIDSLCECFLRPDRCPAQGITGTRIGAGSRITAVLQKLRKSSR